MKVARNKPHALHPSVELMQPSPEQRPAIEMRDRDVVVTAGAGAGKTRTLVARYLALLADGLPLRSILAITFTRKAAREMRNRVREAMRAYLESQNLPLAERERWLQYARELDAARIGTIHSLCTEILRAHPAEAALDPRFEVLDEGIMNLLQVQVVDEAMGQAGQDAAGQQLFALLGEGVLRDTLATLLKRGADAATAFERVPPAGLARRWQNILAAQLELFLLDERVQSGFSELLDLRTNGAIRKAASAGDRLAEPLTDLLATWDAIAAAHKQGDWVTVTQNLKPLRDNMKQLGRGANWQPHDPKAIIKNLQDLYDEQLKDLVGEGISFGLDQQLAAAMPALRRLFDFAQARYTALKTERQALDFDDLEQMALSLLRDNAAVRVRWQGEVGAMLVDEFQDTNARQRDLVALLNGSGRKLFIVGDAKQSIYRFRGADVTVFRAERSRIERSGGEVLNMSTSYRAHRDLVSGLNDLLRPILGVTADPRRKYVELFAPLQPSRTAPAQGMRAPHIELHLGLGSKTSGGLERAARAVAARIAELVQSATIFLDQDGGKRPLGYGDVAILCSASTSFSAYEGALEQARIPFLTVAGRGFYNRPEIRDLLNMLQAIADPTDDLALLGLLRSPAFGLSDAGLYLLRTEQLQHNARECLWNMLRMRIPASYAALTGPDAARATRTVDLLERLHQRSARTPVAELLKALLDLSGYRAALIRAGQGRSARNVAKLLSDAHASGMVSIGEFLEYVQGLRDSGARESEARATAEGAVQIMSVHAAKGLEFPVVVVGDIGHQMISRNGLLIDEDLGIVLKLDDGDGSTCALYRLARLRDQDQEAAESDRLLYVAATRAQEKLILSGNATLNSKSHALSTSGWLKKLAETAFTGLEELERTLDETAQQPTRGELRAGDTPVACVVYGQGMQWPDANAVAPTPAHETPADHAHWPLLEPIAADPLRSDERATQKGEAHLPQVWRVVPVAERPTAPSYVIGSLVHEALAAWRFPDPGFDQWVQARARGYGLMDPAQLRDAAAETRRLLERFHRCALFAEMDGAERRLHEQSYNRMVAGTAENGVIDALYLRAGLWTIVDYKTDRVDSDAQLARLLSESDYLAQIRRYQDAAEQPLGQRPRGVLCLLNYRGGVRLEPVPGL